MTSSQLASRNRKASQHHLFQYINISLFYCISISKQISMKNFALLCVLYQKYGKNFVLVFVWNFFQSNRRCQGGETWLKKKTQDEFNYMYEITDNTDYDTNLASHTSYLARFLHALDWKTENDISLLSLCLLFSNYRLRICIKALLRSCLPGVLENKGTKSKRGIFWD